MSALEVDAHDVCTMTYSNFWMAWACECGAVITDEDIERRGMKDAVLALSSFNP